MDQDSFLSITKKTPTIISTTYMTVSEADRYLEKWMIEEHRDLREELKCNPNVFCSIEFSKG
jgi:hypothetical protein